MLFAILSMAVACINVMHCAAAVISGIVVSAACVSAAPAHVLNKVYDFKVS